MRISERCEPGCKGLFQRRVCIRFIGVIKVAPHARLPVCERESWPRLETAGVFFFRRRQSMKMTRTRAVRGLGPANAN